MSWHGDSGASAGGTITDSDGNKYNAILHSFPDFADVEASFRIEDASGFSVSTQNVVSFDSGANIEDYFLNDSIYIKRNTHTLYRHDAITLEVLASVPFSNIVRVQCYDKSVYVVGVKNSSVDPMARAYRLDPETLEVLAASSISAQSIYFFGLQFTQNGAYVRNAQATPLHLYRLDLLTLETLATYTVSQYGSENSIFPQVNQLYIYVIKLVRLVNGTFIN